MGSKDSGGSPRTSEPVRRLREELARCQEKYRRFYENLPHLCVSVKSHGVIVGCNKRFASLFRRSPENGTEAMISAFMKPEDHAPFLEFLGRAAGRDVFTEQKVFDFGAPGSDTRFKLNVRVAAIEEEKDGTVITLTMEDVTQIIEIEEERKASRRQLYRSAHLAATATFASGVAHEMNNPLTAILGFSSALVGRINGGENIDKGELATWLQVIYNESVRCRDIVEHLSRFASDTGEYRIGPVPLRECLASAIRLVARKADKRGITVANEIGDGALALADANKLEQVFLNLLTNCLDFCPQGSAVRVEQLPAGEGTIPYVRCAVRDNGPGMTSDVLAKAFDPFFTTKEPGQGIGMGLAICHKIMEDLNGRIDLMSEPGAGTSVFLELPSGEQKAVL